MNKPNVVFILACCAGEPQLYRIDIDPGEEHDVAAQYPARVASMVQMWDGWFGDVTTRWLATYTANTRP